MYITLKAQIGCHLTLSYVRTGESCTQYRHRDVVRSLVSDGAFMWTTLFSLNMANSQIELPAVIHYCKILLTYCHILLESLFVGKGIWSGTEDAMTSLRFFLLESLNVGKGICPRIECPMVPMVPL
jgi:hypothetical protein